MSYRFILASNSPRRRELLSLMGIKFTVVVPEIEEKVLQNESPENMVARLSDEKASDVAARCGGAWILAADTIVVCGGEIFGKPKNESEAIYMMRRLTDCAHHVYTGITIISPEGEKITASEETKVFFRHLRDKDIEDYISLGEWKDKAGGYAVQGAGALLVERLEGCYYNVVGLPIVLVSKTLSRMGFGLSEQWGIVE